MKSHAERTSPSQTRAIAWFLLVAFVLQSAVVAGRGCLPSALGAECCCATPAPEPEPISDTSVPACCSSREAEPERGAPSVESKSVCTCESTLGITRELAPQVHSSELERTLAHLAFEDAHATRAEALIVRAMLVATRALDRPPDPCRASGVSVLRQRLAARGVMGLLSELGTLLR